MLISPLYPLSWFLLYAHFTFTSIAIVSHYVTSPLCNVLHMRVAHFYLLPMPSMLISPLCLFSMFLNYIYLFVISSVVVSHSSCMSTVGSHLCPFLLYVYCYTNADCFDNKNLSTSVDTPFCTAFFKNPKQLKMKKQKIGKMRKIK